MSDIANFAADHAYWAGVREKKHAAAAEREFNNYVSAIPLPHQRAQQAPQAQPAQPQGGQAEPVAAGLQNQAKEPPSVADMTGYLTDLIDAHQKFKRPVPKELLDSAYSYMQNARDNGYHDALIQMSKGNPKGAEDAFNRSGLGRIAITDFKPTKTNIGGMEHDSYLATYQHLDENGQPVGQPVKADVTKELFSQLDLEKRFKMAVEGMNANSDKTKSDADVITANARKSEAATAAAKGISGKSENLLPELKEGADQIALAYGVKLDAMGQILNKDAIKDMPGYFAALSELQNRHAAGEKIYDIVNDVTKAGRRKQELKKTGAATPSVGMPQAQAAGADYKHLWK